MPTASSLRLVPVSCACRVPPDVSAQQDIDDLLSGITAEDLDDFAFAENENRREDGPRTAERTMVADLNTPHMKAEEYVSRAKDAGFSTARGKAIAPPSKTALEKAKRLWHQIGEDGEEEALAANFPSKHQRISVSIEDRPTAPSAGFRVGRGAPDPNLLSARSKKAPMVFQEGPTLFHSSIPSSSMIPIIPEPQPGTTAADFSMGFQTGRGTSIAEPSSSAQRKALSMFAEIESTADYLLDINPQSGAPSNFRLASGKSAPTPNRSSVAKVTSLFEDVKSSSSPRPMPSRSLRSSVQHQLPTSQPSTPLRKPLMTTTNTYSDKTKSSAIKTPSTGPRRIGLGVTSTVLRSRPKFITPFRTTTIPTKGSMTPSLQIQKSLYNPVFDLTMPSQRLSLKQYHLHPQYNTYEELVEMGIPNDICAISPATAQYYQFLFKDNTHVGTDEALAVMRRCGCALVTPEWTKNHWVQILWKLAGEVQARPDLLTEKWSWEEVISQLKYRYEREFGVAQRPLVRRILERDSSPSLPMVLLVSTIHSIDGEDGSVGSLELTDGWYCINAQIDDCLKRAVVKGKIVVGRKLAITGAKLQSSSEGTDVFEARKTCRLVLSGNSTSLARWHARLGMRSQPYISGLSSLSVDGGVITLMDIVIERLFPIAFTNGDRNIRESPWNEEEEKRRQDKWKERYWSERTRLMEWKEKEVEKVRDLGALLTQYAIETSPAGLQEESSDTMENEFEELLHAKDLLSRMRNFSSIQISHLARYAQLRLSREMEEGRIEVETELETICPPRDVRDFRMIRFRDGREGHREAFRKGMLSVWDARALGSTILKEGKRYLVSNLVPGKSGDWRVGRRQSSMAEVYLHTRRDTRWVAL
ncbi:breast cancer 2 susceptibility protein [Cryptococcus neoformans c45]|nr:breast cancer 2 susceptibility protein [Cryptococcus neoformans var. grubii c45]